MDLCKTRAALAAAKEFKTCRNRIEALKVYETVLKQAPKSGASSDCLIDDDILAVMLVQMEKESELYHSGLSVEQTLAHLLRECDALLSQLSGWFRRIRRLNGGCLPTDELYELEATALSIGS